MPRERQKQLRPQRTPGALRANEAPRIFALARARLIWAALRTSGLASRTAKENCPVSKALSGVEILLKSSKLTEVPVERA